MHKMIACDFSLLFLRRRKQVCDISWPLNAICLVFSYA